MRTLVIGDIHGGYKALDQIITRVELKPTDTLIFLGDYVDGWSEAAETITYLIELNEEYNCIFIKGNHDVWCGSWLEVGKTNPIWLAHGGEATIESYIKTGLITAPSHKQFFKQLKNYYIDQQNRLFIHAGFTSMHGVLQEEYESNYYWDRTLWEAALLAHKVEDNKLENDQIKPQRFSHYHEIFIGHTATTNYNTTTPIQAYKLWNIDTGAGFTGRLTILDVDTKEYWQSDIVRELYPREKGRN